MELTDPKSMWATNHNICQFAQISAHGNGGELQSRTKWEFELTDGV
jgi:hypothetical protein